MTSLIVLHSGMLGLWLGKEQSTVRVTGALEDAAAEGNVDQLKRSQRGIVLSSEIWTIPVIFWQRMCLLFALVLRICLRLN